MVFIDSSIFTDKTQQIVKKNSGVLHVFSVELDTFVTGGTVCSIRFRLPFARMLNKQILDIGLY